MASLLVRELNLASFVFAFELRPPIHFFVLVEYPNVVPPPFASGGISSFSVNVLCFQGSVDLQYVPGDKVTNVTGNVLKPSRRCTITGRRTWLAGAETRS